MVLINVRLEIFSKGALSKLHTKRAGPFKVLRQLGSNAYYLELSADVQFSPIFNVADLISYEGHDGENPRVEVVAFLPLAIRPREVIKEILDDQVVSTRRGGYQKFLVK